MDNDSFEMSPESYDPGLNGRAPKIYGASYGTHTSRNEGQPQPSHSHAPSQPAPNRQETTSHESASRSATASSETHDEHSSVSRAAQTVAHAMSEGAEAIRRVGLRRWMIFGGVVLLVIAGYLLIVSLSYFHNHTADQSIVQYSSYRQAVEQSSRVVNQGGPLGAWVSERCLAGGLGLGFFPIIFLIAAFGLRLVRAWRPKMLPLTCKSLICAIALSSISGFLTLTMLSDTMWGGLHGYWLNRLLITHTGIWGALGVNILLLTGVFLLFLTPIQHMVDMWRERLQAHRRRMAARREAAAARRREAEIALAQEQTAEAQPSESPADLEFNTTLDDTTDSSADYPPTTSQPTLADEPVQEPDESSPEAISHSAEESPTVVNHPDELENEPVIAEITIADDEPEVVIYETPVGEISGNETNDTESAEQSTGGNSEGGDKDSEDEDVKLTVETHTMEIAKVLSQPDYDPTAELSHFRFPTLDLLIDRPSDAVVNEDEQEENKDHIVRALSSFGITISQIKATVGPTVTLYEIVPTEGIRIQRIKSLEDDIALALSALGVRIIAPIPGKGTIGIEVPNKRPQVVSMRAILSSVAYQESKAELPLAIGSTISNEVYIADLCKIPHLLVAGATGMGKSVGLNAIIASLLYRKHPTELKLVLIDPKMVEFSLYSRLESHYLAKLPAAEDAVITDMKNVVPTLNSLCVEMDNRYLLLKEAGVRSIKEYNAQFGQHRLNPEKGHRFLPYIVVIVDEFADLIMTAGKEVETPIARIAQKARAVGIHMILATQRPSTNVITGVIKANFPGRIAFRVTAMVDSRTIIDRPGANQLIGKGDMLFYRDGSMERVQCAFIDTPEVVAICDAISSQPGLSPYILPEYVPETPEGASSSATLGDRDPLFEEAGRYVIDANLGSTSALQRRFTIGFPRAGKIMDQLEVAGVVGPARGGKPREVLMSADTFETYLSTL